MSHLEYYEDANRSFRSGSDSVMSETNEVLIKHLFSLANQNNINEGTQHRDIIRGITINHILMQRHIDDLNKQNTKTQRWVIALAVAALLSSLAQVVSPHLFPVQPIVIIQQAPTVQSESPNQVNPPSSSQATKKTH